MLYLGPTPPFRANILVPGHQRITTNNAGHAGESDAPNIGGPSTNRVARERHRWTNELRQELMACLEAAAPERRGYMVRLHALWVENHPELNCMRQQNLRDQVAFVRRTERARRNSDSASSSTSAVSTTSAAKAERQAPQEEDTTLRAEFLRSLQHADQRSLRLKFKNRIPEEHLSKMNSILEEHLTHESTLWDIDCAVFAAAKTLCLRRGPSQDPTATNKRRIAQLSRKVTLERQKASRIECVVQVLHKKKQPTRKVKQIMFNLRREYHTLNIQTLSLLKRKALDKVSALSLARKKLVNRARWVDENRQFHLNPSRLFKPKDQLPLRSPTVNETETFWKNLYETEVQLRDTPALDRFKGYCNRKITEQTADLI